MEVEADTIGHAHEKAISLILQYGEEVVTEDREYTLELPEPLYIKVRDPFKEPVLSSCCSFGPRFTAEYVKQLLTITPKTPDGFEYTYGNRLLSYPVPIATDACEIDWCGDGSFGGINQIDRYIIQKLIRNPSTRRAIAHIWVPYFDHAKSHPPCMQTVQALLRGRYLDIIATFRSNDILSAWCQNTVGLSGVMRYIIDSLNQHEPHEITSGHLVTFSTSAHIYYKRDTDELNKFRAYLRV